MIVVLLIAVIVLLVALIVLCLRNEAKVKRAAFDYATGGHVSFDRKRIGA